jgi:hypothetical protein
VSLQVIAGAALGFGGRDSGLILIVVGREEL